MGLYSVAGLMELVKEDLPKEVILLRHEGKGAGYVLTTGQLNRKS